MNEPVHIDPRQRMRELLAIPERDRTDAQWDELVELEIQQAPGNRLSQPPVEPGRRQGSQAEPGRRQGAQAEPGRRQGQRQGPRQGQGQGAGQGQQRQMPRPEQGQGPGAKPEEGGEPQVAKRTKRHRRPPPKV